MNKLKDDIFSNLIRLSIGSVAAQLINVIIQPILTRLVTPGELGAYTFIITIAGVVVPIASMKMDLLIIVSDDEIEAAYITDVCIICLAITTMISFFLIVFMIYCEFETFEKIGILALMIPFVIVSNGLRSIFISHNNKKKKYSLISRTNVMREAILSLMQIIAGLFHWGTFGLTFGNAIAPVFCLRSQAEEYVGDLRKRKFISLGKMLSIIANNKKHILLMVPSQFINSLSFGIITFSIVSLFSTTEAGYYSISVRVLGLPLIIVSSNFSRIFVQKLSEDIRNNIGFYENFKSSIKLLTLVSIIGFSVLACIAPYLCEVVFGYGYYEAGLYISILCFMFAIRFIASSIVGIFIIFNKQNYDLIFNCMIVAVGMGAYLVTAIYNLDIYNYLLIISISYGFIYALIILCIVYLCKNANVNNLI